MPQLPGPGRLAYIDHFRGLLMAHMALDHCSMFLNPGRPPEEYALATPAAPTDLAQFLTRFSGVAVAPGFSFIAGFMVAFTSASREERGTPSREVTRRLVIRGLVLIAVDMFIAGLPRAIMDFWWFAKYPPDLAWLTWSFAAIFAGLAVLHRFSKNGPSPLLHPFLVFGRVAFFFYVVHMYVLGFTAGPFRGQVGLGGTYVAWLVLCAVMLWPCAWYYRKKIQRPNLITRYL